MRARLTQTVLVVVLVAGFVSACAVPGASSEGDETALPTSGCPDAAASAPGKAANPVQDPEFWAVIRKSCEVSNDGDELQAEALRELLRTLEPAQVELFHREFRKANRALYTQAFVTAADHVCQMDELGLGDDLGTDYRSWTVAHGRAAYEAVLGDPQALADFDDAELGCGSGEPMTYAALEVYDELTGLGPEDDGLPQIEPVDPPR